MKKFVSSIAIIALVLGVTSCSKNKKSEDPQPITPIQNNNNDNNNGDNSSTIRFIGSIDNKYYDNNDNLIGSDSESNVESKLKGTTPNFLLSIIDDDESVTHEINIVVNNESFEVDTSGVSAAGGIGAFENGVYGGYYNGDSLYYLFPVVAQDGYVIVSYYGKVEGSGGNGGDNGGTGSTGITATWSTGSSSFTANGTSYTSNECEGHVGDGAIELDLGTNMTEFSVAALNVTGSGTYDVVMHVYDGDDLTHDQVEAVIPNALTITSISTASVSGTVSFTYDDLTISNCSFTLYQ